MDTNLRAPSLQAKARRTRSGFSLSAATDMYLKIQTPQLKLDDKGRTTGSN